MSLIVMRSDTNISFVISRLTLSRCFFGASYTTGMNASSYRPLISAASWQRIESFVEGTVSHRCAEYTAEWRYQHRHALTYFADWVTATHMVPLEQSLRADVIDVYTAERAREISPSVATRERALLRRLAGLENTFATANRTAPSTPSAPYAKADIVELHSWALHQRTEYLHRACLAVFALCLGCGLTSGEALAVSGRDITELPGSSALAVNVANRTVPVMARWHDELAALKFLVPDTQLAIAPNAASRQATLQLILQSTPNFRPNPQRMRITWLLTHVNAGTHLATLLAAAGLTSLETLRRHLHHLSPLPYAPAMDALRLAGATA